MNTVAESFKTTMRQMTEMSPLKRRGASALYIFTGIYSLQYNTAKTSPTLNRLFTYPHKELASL